MSKVSQYIKSIIGNDNPQEECILRKKSLRNSKRIGDESLYGDISLVEVGSEKAKAVLKKIPIEKGIRPNNTSTALGVELKMLELVTELTDLQITKHFSTLVAQSVCNDCTYSNENLDKGVTKCLALLAPFSDSGTLKGYIQSGKASESDYLNIYFQIFSALYVLQTYFNASHHDLHWSNVFLTKNEFYYPGAIEIYTIQGIDYYLPSFPFTAQIADFGFARIPKKLEIKEFKKYYKQDDQENRNGADYVRIVSMLWETRKSKPVLGKLFEKVFTEYKAGSPVASLFPLIFKEYQYRPRDSFIVRVWNLDQRVPDFREDLKFFVRREMLSRKSVNILPPVPPNTPMDEVAFSKACGSILNDPQIYNQGPENVSIFSTQVNLNGDDDMNMDDDEDEYRFMRPEAYI